MCLLMCLRISKMHVLSHLPNDFGCAVLLLRDNYLYAIIKVRNYLRAIEILKSSSVPSPEVSFTYVPLSLVFQAKKTILPSVIECIKIFILSCDSKKLHFFLCTIMKKIMVTACACACEKL